MTPRVLIADDERDMATIVAYGVRMLWPDAAVATAADGVEALRRFD
jgi:CheY-like chemotaxis protein